MRSAAAVDYVISGLPGCLSGRLRTFSCVVKNELRWPLRPLTETLRLESVTAVQILAQKSCEVSRIGPCRIGGRQMFELQFELRRHSG